MNPTRIVRWTSSGRRGRCDDPVSSNSASPNGASARPWCAANGSTSGEWRVASGEKRTIALLLSPLATRHSPLSAMKRRIVITGMGAITPVGHGVEELFAALAAGRSGVGPITRFDASAFPTRFAAEVKDFDLGPFRGRRRPLGRLRPQHALRPGRLAPGDGRRRPPRRRRRGPDALRRLPRRRRRDARFPLLPLDGGPQLPRGRGTHRPGCPLRPRRPRVQRAAGVRAGVSHDAGPRRRTVRPGRAELQLPDGLRRWRPGRRRSGRDDPPRRRRPHAGRRLARHDPPDGRDRVQPADRPVHAERRPAKGVAAVRPATATASSSARAPAWSSSKNWNTPAAAAP